MEDEFFESKKQVPASAKTGYQEVLSEEEKHSDVEDDLKRAINGVEIKFNNLKFGKQLGNGYYGEVYEADYNGKRVAVKVLSGGKTTSLRKAFKREIETLKLTIESPNIVRLIGAVVKPYCCIVMELMEGGSLYELIHEKHARLNFEQVINIARDIAEGLKYLHTLPVPILHRDVTSKNVLVKHEDGFYRAVLSDFGIARKSDSNRPLSPLGPKRYRAPEITKKDPSGAVYYSKKVDIYMFGTVLYELIYQKDPFAAISEKDIEMNRQKGISPNIPESGLLGDHNKRVPQVLRHLVKRCWSPYAEERPKITTICKYMQAIQNKIAQIKQQALENEL